MSSISLFIPVVLPVMDVFLAPYFEFSTSDKHIWKFKKIRQQHVWHEIVSWDCKFKHAISTCRLCHGTATSGYRKYVRLKMDGLLEPWQALKYVVIFVYDVCCTSENPMPVSESVWSMYNTMQTGRYGAWLSTVVGHVGTRHVHYRCVAYTHIQLLMLPES